ncbi:MAG TPA: DNA repair protein RecN [Myxococcaceae bacterium]|nr:DNA repair protein RecN [Myxococcaceae bacterium]
MLEAVRISNFAVIDEAEVQFEAGLTVLTGETGAGKSILVDALGLLVGARAEAEVIRAGAEEASVEGLFRRTAALSSRLAELGLPDLGEQVAIRRTVGRSGRGRAYANGALVTLGVLGRLTRGLVDISGQHEHIGLFDASTHRQILDGFARIEPRVQAYRAAFGAFRAAEARLAAVGGDERGVRDRAELVRIQLEEIDQLAPRPGEDGQLEEERRRLMSAEKLRRSCEEANARICAQEHAALELVGAAATLVVESARLDSRLTSISEHLASAAAGLEEAGRELSRYLAQLEGDPARLAEVDDRLDALRRLCRKHGTDLPGVLRRRSDLAAEAARFEDRDGSLAALRAECSRCEERCWEIAREISALRSESAGEFGKRVREALGGLALAKAKLEVRLTPSAALGPEGADDLEFLFSANPGEPLRPLAKVVSGGEASRLLLALKAVLASSGGGGCYVLDEADSGVSGAVAEVVGRMIKEVSLHHQVLCITHLPQVAAYADHHLAIRKQQRAERTVSRVIALADADERTRELARMLAGVKLTREAIGAAQALVRAAARVPSLKRRRKREATSSARSRRERRTA